MQPGYYRNVMTKDGNKGNNPGMEVPSSKQSQIVWLLSLAQSRFNRIFIEIQ